MQITLKIIKNLHKGFKIIFTCNTKDPSNGHRIATCTHTQISAPHLEVPNSSMALYSTTAITPRSKLSLLSPFFNRNPNPRKPYLLLSSTSNFPNFSLFSAPSSHNLSPRARSPAMAMAESYEREIAAAKKAASLAARLCQVRRS